MSTSSPQTAIPKVRTYAADLTSVRSKKSGGVSAKKVVVNPTIVEPIITDNHNDGIVPPFHAFSNPAKNITAPAFTTPEKTATPSQAETQSIITKSSNVSAQGLVKESLPAVIITDTKHKRFKLSEALAHSMSDWWSNKKDAAKKKKIPRYTVPEAERRKGVIQKATAKTGRTSSADHSAVVSRIKATKQIPHGTELSSVSTPKEEVKLVSWETATPALLPEQIIVSNPTVLLRQNHTTVNPVEVKKDTSVPAKNWESDIQAQVNKLAEPTPTSRIVASVKELEQVKRERGAVLAEPSPIPTIAVKKIVPTIPAPITVKPIRPVIPVLPTVTIPPPVQPTPQTFVPRPEPAPTPIIPAPISRARIIPTIPQPPTSVVATATPVLAAINVAVPPREERRFAPPREIKKTFLSSLLQTNQIVFIAFGVLLFVVISGLGLRAYMQNSAVTAPSSLAVTEPGIFIDTTVATDKYFVSTVTDIANTIQAQKSGTDSLVELNFVNQTGEPLTPSDILAILNADVLFDFKSTLTRVSLGTYRESPWLVFRISDKNTALGGMLDWENTLYRDVAPILTTNTQLSRNRFADAIIGTVDVRMLKNADDTEALVYGFIDANTLLITTNTTAFLNLAGKLK